MLRSLAEFTDNMGSAMAALGMFAQGLGGGLALLSLFMTYLQYATAGIDGFLGYYSAHAQVRHALGLMKYSWLMLMPQQKQTLRPACCALCCRDSQCSMQSSDLMEGMLNSRNLTDPHGGGADQQLAVHHYCRW